MNKTQAHCTKETRAHYAKKEGTGTDQTGSKIQKTTTKVKQTKCVGKRTDVTHGKRQHHVCE